MKNIKKLVMSLGTTFAALALTVTTVASNSACRIYIYQPKLPAEAAKLKKF